MDERIELKLIEEAKSGSHQAFEKLIIEHEKRIYAICLRMLGQEQEAYDAAQEVCIKIWRQLKYFEGQSKFTTWLYRVVTNQCLDHIRKQKRKEEVSLYKKYDDSGHEETYEQEEHYNPIEEHMERMAMQDVMTRALNELKKEYKEILVLRDMQGHTYDEIAEVLDLSSGTVKSRLSRARQALKNILEQNKEPYRSFLRHISKREGSL